MRIFDDTYLDGLHVAVNLALLVDRIGGKLRIDEAIHAPLPVPQLTFFSCTFHRGHNNG